MSVYQSGQMGRTVNPLAQVYVGSSPTAGTYSVLGSPATPLCLGQRELAGSNPATLTFLESRLMTGQRFLEQPLIKQNLPRWRNW